MRRLALVFVLVLEWSFPYPLHAHAAKTAGEPGRYPRWATTPLRDGQQALVHGFQDALLELLDRHPAVAFTVALATDDPALDADPFFLRGQAWVPVPAEPAGDASSVAVRWDGDRTVLALAGAARALALPEALRPLGVAGNFLWLAALDSERFESPRPDDHGEGVFLLRADDVLQGARDGSRVPVFFLPLPGRGWAGPRVALASVPAQDRVVLIDESGGPLPVPLDDVDTVVDAERLNLTLALGLAARARSADGRLLAEPLLPLPGSTAGFGMLFTGFDRESGTFLYDRASLHAGAWARARQWLHAAARQLGLPTAHAEGTDEAAAAAQKLYDSLTRVGAVLAIASISAIVLKHTLFREHFARRAAQDEAQYGPDRGRAPRLTRWAKDVGTTLAHNLTFLSNFASVWFGHGVQYIVDRFFPSLGSGKNQRLNRFLDATIYFTKSTGEKLPVNYRTLLLGALVLGGVDSVLVATQLYFVVPWMAQAYAKAVPESAAKVNEIFQLGNPMTEVYNRNESIRNFASYLTSGASAFSAQLRAQLMSVYGPSIDEEMRKEGLDPLDSRNKQAREARLEAKLEQVFHQLGLPGKEDFLFDATTLWKGALGLLGYAPADIDRETAPSEGHDARRDGETYVGEAHPGLVVSALKRALKEARRREALSPADPALCAARELLEKTLADVGKLRQLSLGGLRATGQALRQSLAALRQAASHPLHSVARAIRHPLQSLRSFFGPVGSELWEAARLLRQTRQRLFALTYEGPLGQDLRHLPSEWIAAAGRPGASLAGHLFRRAFFGYLQGDRKVLEGAPDDRWLALEATHRERAERGAVEAIKKRYPERFEALLREFDGTAAVAEKELVKEHGAEYLMLVEDAVEQAWLEQTEANAPFEPPRRSWFQKRQDRAAARQAAERFRAQASKVFDPATATPDEVALYRKLYTEASLNGIGLFPRFDRMKQLEEPIAKAAEAVTQAQVESPKARAWLESLPPHERVDFLATLYADNYASAYINVVANAAEGLAQQWYAEAHPEHRRYDPNGATKEERRLWRRVFAEAVMDPGQPGRFQWTRQNGLFANVPVLRWLTSRLPFQQRMLRGLEAFFPIEAHQKGFWNFVYRNVPGLYDLIVANKLMLRRILTQASATYWSVYAIWGVALPLHLWILAQLTVFTVSGPWFFLNRFCRLQGLQPMSGVGAMAAYAFAGSWLTMGGTFPMLWYEKDMATLLERIGLGGAGTLDPLRSTVIGCIKLLSGGATPVANEGSP